MENDKGELVGIMKNPKKFGKWHEMKKNGNQAFLDVYGIYWLLDMMHHVDFHIYPLHYKG